MSNHAQRRRPYSPPVPGSQRRWQREYRYRWKVGRAGYLTTEVESDDGPMDDPETRRLWLSVDLVLAVIVVACLLGLAFAALT